MFCDCRELGGKVLKVSSRVVSQNFALVCLLRANFVAFENLLIVSRFGLKISNLAEFESSTSSGLTQAKERLLAHHLLSNLSQTTGFDLAQLPVTTLQVLHE